MRSTLNRNPVRMATRAGGARFVAWLDTYCSSRSEQEVFERGVGWEGGCLLLWRTCARDEERGFSPREGWCQLYVGQMMRGCQTAK